MTDQPTTPKSGTWGAFKAAMEAAGVQDDDQIAHFNTMGTPVITRWQTTRGEWWVAVE